MYGGGGARPSGGAAIAGAAGSAGSLAATGVHTLTLGLLAVTLILAGLLLLRVAAVRRGRTGGR